MQQSLLAAVGAAAGGGCGHYFSALTTPQSQRIFDKLGFRTLKTLDYDDFRDSDGNRYVDDVEDGGGVCVTVHKAL